MAWVRRWAGRRPDIDVAEDVHGNLLLTQAGASKRTPVIAVAHTDHPGFVIEAVDGRSATVEFRGGVRREYFDGARVEFFDGDDAAHRGTLTEFDHDASRGTVLLDRTAPLRQGDIGRWFFGAKRKGSGRNFLLAPACDDLAGAAAALSSLDRARSDETLGGFGVLLTRAEEVGFVGAIGACRSGTLPKESRVLSIECSRSFSDSPLGAGPIVRVGDASSVFDHDLTNRIAEAARSGSVTHQRKLMAGGSCEATAFVAYGYRATGLCLPLGNYHNMGYLDEVEQGKGMAKVLPEIVAMDDFEGLVDLLLVAARAVDSEWSLRERLETRFDQSQAIL